MAVKLALVDPRHLEYKDVHKTSKGLVRTDLSMEMKKILNDPNMPDDQKIKLYRQTLNRFLKTGDKIDDANLPPINYTLAPPRRSGRRKIKKKKRHGDYVWDEW